MEVTRNTTFFTSVHHFSPSSKPCILSQYLVSDFQITPAGSPEGLHLACQAMACRCSSRADCIPQQSERNRIGNRYTEVVRKHSTDTFATSKLLNWPSNFLGSSTCSANLELIGVWRSSIVAYEYAKLKSYDDTGLISIREQQAIQCIVMQCCLCAGIYPLVRASTPQFYCDTS